MAVTSVTYILYLDVTKNAPFPQLINIKPLVLVFFYVVVTSESQLSKFEPYLDTTGTQFSVTPVKMQYLIK